MRRRNRWRFAIAAIMVVIGCSGSADKPGEKSIRVNGRPYLTNMPLLIADAEGYFADEGLHIEYVELPDHTSQAIPALDNGRLDVIAGIVSVGVFNAVARGAAIRIVADKGQIDSQTCDYAGIIGRRGVFPPGAVSADDIRGRKFSITFVGSNGYIFSRFLEKLKVRESEIETVGLSAATEAQALETGAIDGLITSEPWVSRLVGAGHRLIAPARSFAARQQQAVLLFGPTLVSQDRDAGTRFMRAYLRGVRRFREGHTPANTKFVSEQTGIDSARMKGVCWPAFDPDGAVDTGALGEFQQWAHARGMLDRVVTPTEYLDSDFATRAAASLKSGRPE